ncbi:MAG: ABC transporter ATP-binding protein [Bacteriovoracaceae bacterium]
MGQFIEVQNLKKHYGKVKALDGVSLGFEENEQYVIVGSSGSGKSTLLYTLGGLEKPKEGEIKVDGLDIHKLDDEELAKFRNQKVGFVFQFHFLLPSMTCLDNMLLPCKISGGSIKKTKEKVKELSEELGVSHCLKKYPFELSGGEQQRINIIRALSLEPKLLLCDEPTGNLDSENSEKVVRLLKKLAKQYNATLIMVTHDLEIASEFEKQIVMRDGINVEGERVVPSKVSEPANSLEKKLDQVESQTVSNKPSELPETPIIKAPKEKPIHRSTTEELIEETQKVIEESEMLLSKAPTDQE